MLGSSRVRRSYKKLSILSDELTKETILQSAIKPVNHKANHM